MDVRNCPRCGKVFTYLTSPVCPACEKKEEDVFQSIKKYIEEHPLALLAEIADELKVPPKRILSYIKEGRLQVSSGLRSEIACESCGKHISSGRYCESCLVRMSSDINDLFKGTKPSAKMHTISKKL